MRSGYNKAMKLGVGSYQYTPDDGFTIDWGTTNYVNPQIYRTTWGSEDAMKNIAFMRHDGTQYMSVSPGDTQMSVDVAANEAHPFKIEVYNANAIAERHTGTLGMNLSLLDGGTETKKAESSAEVKFLMQPAAINATLPAHRPVLRLRRGRLGEDPDELRRPERLQLPDQGDRGCRRKPPAVSAS